MNAEFLYPDVTWMASALYDPILRRSHYTRDTGGIEFEAGAVWSRLIDYRVPGHCLTTGWSSIVPSHGFPVKKRTNHDGVGCYSNMAARQ